MVLKVKVRDRWDFWYCCQVRCRFGLGIDIWEIVVISKTLKVLASVATSDSKLLDFEILDCSNLFFQIPGLPGGLEFKFHKRISKKRSFLVRLCLWSLKMLVYLIIRLICSKSHLNRYLYYLAFSISYCYQYQIKQLNCRFKYNHNQNAISNRFWFY